MSSNTSDVLPLFTPQQNDELDMDSRDISHTRPALLERIFGPMAVGIMKFFKPVTDGVKEVLAPRIFLTSKADVRLPPNLSNIDRAENSPDPSEPVTRLYRVKISTVAEGVRQVEKHLSRPPAFCALELPQGEAKLVIRSHFFGEVSYKLFRYSDLRFLKFVRRPEIGEYTYFLCCEDSRLTEDMLRIVQEDCRECLGLVTLVYPSSIDPTLVGFLGSENFETFLGRGPVRTAVIPSDLLHRKSFSPPQLRLAFSQTPPLVVLHGNKVYKILWHSKGRTLITTEHKLWFTGTGVKVRRQSFTMWISLIVGIALTITYVAARSDSTNLEDLIQTALAIGAIYAAAIIPLTYYMFYEGENLLDVVTGKVHLDTRQEFDKLSDEERLHLCLQSLKLPDSDRAFIDGHNTSYASGSVAGAPMRVNLLPCIGNLLAVGFKYWESNDFGDRKGLISPTRRVLELKENHQLSRRGNKIMRLIDPDLSDSKRSDFERNILHLADLTETECPYEYYWVGY